MAKLATGWSRNLYKIGSIAALLASLVFRRNLGVAEIPLFTGIVPPSSVAGWFTLLHNNPLLGLTLLNVFDIANYTLVGLMFIAVYVVLRDANRSFTLLALALSLSGASVYVVSNSAIPMLSLSSQYASATTNTQKSTLLAAGQAVLANGYNSGSVYQGAGFYLSLLFLALAGMLISIVMLRSRIFYRATAYIGIAASAFDLTYLIGLAFVPAVDVYLLGAICIAAGGLFLMIWHLLIGVKLYRLSSKPNVKRGVNLE